MSLLSVVGPVLVSAALFPSLAPPTPDRLLSQVAELVLRTRLRECGSCDISVQADPASLLSGGVNGVRVSGRNWCTPMQLSCRALDFDVGSTAVDLVALSTQQRILLKRPAEGSATICFAASDWDSFLLHPQLAACVAARRAAAPAPAVSFSQSGGTRLLVSKSGEGVVAFPVRFGGVELAARLSQRPDGSVACVARRLQPATPDAAAAPDDDDAAARAGPWLAGLFETLVLDLDGCALSFRSLSVAGAPQPELALQLDVCVRSFPSLDINF